MIRDFTVSEFHMHLLKFVAVFSGKLVISAKLREFSERRNFSGHPAGDYSVFVYRDKHVKKYTHMLKLGHLNDANENASSIIGLSDKAFSSVTGNLHVLFYYKYDE